MNGFVRNMKWMYGWWKWCSEAIFYLYLPCWFATYASCSWRQAIGHVTEKGEARSCSLMNTATLIMALNVVNLGFHPSSPSSFVSPKPLKDRFVLGCSRVEQISFTESENSLIEALLGIQGRGRSSSPQQLNVALSSTSLQFLSQFTIHHSFFLSFSFSLSGC